MSSETYTQGNPHRNPEDRRRDIIEEDAPVETYDPRTAKRRRNRIVGFVATGVAAAVFAAGGLAWSQKGGDVEAKAPPVATAPANPNGPTAGASEVAPTPSAGETAQTSEFTLDTFPLVTPDGTFNGIEKFKKGQQLLVSDYEITGDEDDKKKIGELLTDFNTLRNEWINSGVDQMGSDKFNNYKMQYDDPAFNSPEIATGATAVRYTYDQAYKEACVEGDQTLVETLEATHKAVSDWRRTEPSYTAHYEVSGERGNKPRRIYAGNEVTFMDVVTTYSDNLDQTKDVVTKETITFRQELEDDGRLVWKVATSQSEHIGQVAG